jgi:AhpD family alkylhydroperoxidase
MHSRININDLEPDAYKAMFGLEKYLGGTDLDPKLKEIVKIRASQINGCAYCIQMHTEQAMKLGETNQRIFALAAWVESPLFSDTERAVLALTDEMTDIAHGGVSQETYDAALSQLGENGLAQCMMQIVTINAWNRMAIATHMQH